MTKATEAEAMKALLQDGETLEGTFRTQGWLGKYVLVTPKRLIIGHDPKNAKSTLFRHIVGLESSNPWMEGKRLLLTLAGNMGDPGFWSTTSDKLKLHFERAEDRDELQALISARLVADWPGGSSL